MENKNKLSFDILATDNMSEEEFLRAREEFFEKYPECPRDPHIEVLDLVMKREWAEKILSGEKKIEFRDFSDFYCNRLYDKETFDFVDKMLDEDNMEAVLAQNVFFSPIKQVYVIHFHNYNNSWFLDVSLKTNDYLTIQDEDIEFLHKEFNCHELDDDLKKCKEMKISQKNRPQMFYFVIDEVLNTNLK